MQKSSSLPRFIIVGAISTVIDFGALFFLHSLGIGSIVANLLSTSLAFCFSFYANRTYTFKSKGNSLRRESLLFTVVTLFGLWVIQSLIIAAITGWFGHGSLSKESLLLFAKLAATGVSMIWNYVLYKTVVFKVKE